ncbi:translation initiation factor [Puniceicoccales bacterium CK1056]|uniref:Translation initiation factor n=1 Tax=Oceanipulchritudo coccoides TaxID=2706888 RepID=A0A6B2M225_9BACT|nr:translation initiation factor [Oceanipulchritudo coccoides]NDV62988.1 translation initiation factor [Oceanipulchritudo coccoides]
MGKRTKERIDTSGGQSLSAGNPFAGLSAEGLASGPVQPAQPSKPAAPVKKRETLLLRRLKAGKGGKVVTEISGFDCHPDGLAQLLKRLQTRLGTGGTRRGKVLELQGECRAAVKELLEKDGYRVKGI